MEVLGCGGQEGPAMSATPDYLDEFSRRTGIDCREWRVWQTEAMTSIVNIREQAHAVALANYLRNELGMAAEINGPVYKGESWGVVGIPISRTR